MKFYIKLPAFLHELDVQLVSAFHQTLETDAVVNVQRACSIGFYLVFQVIRQNLNLKGSVGGIVVAVVPLPLFKFDFCVNPNTFSYPPHFYASVF